MTIRQKLRITIGLIVIALIAVYTTASYLSERHLLLQAVDQNLLHAVRHAQGGVPADYHDRIVDRESVSPEEFTRIVDANNKLCIDFDLQYLWSCLKVGNQIVFTTATSPSKDVSKRDHAAFFDVHKDPHAFDVVFETMAPHFSTFQNEWGHGRMVLIPGKDRHGRAYCFGASVSFDNMQAELRKTLLHSLYLGMGFLLGGMLASLRISNTLAQPISELTKVADEIAHGQMDQSIKASGSTELVSLGKSLTVMQRSIRQKIGELELEVIERKQAEVIAAKYQLIAQHARDPLLLMEIDGKLLEANRAAETLYGYPREDLLKLNISDLRLPADPALVSRQKQQALTEGILFETVHSRKDGSPMPVEVSSRGISVDGKTMLLSVIRDITQRKKEEEALRKSEERTRHFFEHQTVGMAITSRDKKWLDVNEKLCQILGYTREELVQLTWEQLTHPEDREDNSTLFEQLLAGEINNCNFEKRYVRKDGVVIHALVSISCVQQSDGRLDYVLLLVMDITERKKAEETAQVLHSAIEASVGAVALADLNGIVTYVNRACAELWGYADKAEMIGRSALEFWAYPENAERVITEVSQGKTESSERVAKKQNGTLFDVYISVNSVRDFSGSPLCLMFSAMDITERKAAEARIGRLNQLYAALTQCNQDIVHSANIEELMPKICRDVVQLGGMKLAWIGFVDEATGKVHPATSFGLRTEYVEGLDISVITDDPKGQGPTGTAIRDNQPFWLQDFQNDPCGMPWLERVKQSGWASSASIPLHLGGKAIGALTIYSDVIAAFDEEIRKLLVEMGNNVSFALESFAHEAERKRAEEALRLRSGALEAAANAIVITDSKGTIEWANAAFTTYTGYTVAEALAKTMGLLKSGKHDPAFYQNLWKTISSGEVWHGEIINRRKDGTLYPEEMTITPMKNSRGEISHFIAVKQDITKRKEAEQILRDSEERNRTILQAAMDGFCVVNMHGQLKEVNEAYCRMSGYSPSELLAMRISDLDIVMNEEQIAARIQKILTQGEDRFESRQRRKDGSVFDVEVSVQYRASEGELVSFLHDITERKRAAHAIIQANENLERRVIERTEELKLSKDQLRLLLDSTAEAIYGIDTQGNCTFCNPACLRLLGYEREEELLGKNMHWQTHHKHADGTHFPTEECRIFQAFQMGEGTHVDDEVLWRADGSSFPAEYWSFPQFVDGVAVGSVVTFIDITERKWAEDELKRHVSLINSLLDSIPDIIFFKDIHGVYMGCNPSFAEFVGRPKDEIVGRTDYELFSKDVADFFREHDRTMLELRQTRNNEEWITYPDGRKRLIDTVKTPYWGPSGELMGLLGISRDITDRKWAELEMRKLSRAIEFSPVSIFITDLNGDIEYVNPHFTRLTGYAPEEVLHKNPRILKSELTAPEVYEDLWRTITSGNVWRGDMVNRKKSGEHYVESTVISPVVDANGLLAYYVAIKDDVTERKKTEEAAAQHSRQLQRLLDTAPVGVAISVDGVTRFANPRISEIVDLKLGGATSDIYINSEDRKRILQVLSREDLVQDWELKMRGPNGEIRETMATFLNTEFEEHKGILCWLIDIGKLKAAEIEMRRAKELAENASKGKSAFLANMSHEIRTPMNAILGFSQLMLRDSDLAPQNKKHLEIINRSGDHLLALINDILDMSKIEAGRVELTPSSFDLSALLHDLEAMLRVRTDAKGLRLDILKANDLPQCVVGDKNKILQVLINLLGNAVKFTNRGGVILRASRGNDAPPSLLFEVEDTGIGIPNEAIGRLFRHFEQVHTEQQAGMGSGTGLGLAISRELIHLMGGEIKVASEIGKGSIFTVSIPLTEGESQHEERSARLKRVVTLKPGQPSCRVLIVDDTADNQVLLSEMLHRTGFSTRLASSGNEALELVTTWRPHLILMDMRMPTMTGTEAIQRIRAGRRGGKVKIMSVTANTFESMRREALEAGADDFLSKPFKEEELFEKIRLLLGVEYEYDLEERKAEPVSVPGISDLAPEDIGALPLELAEEIRKAATNADYEILLELLQRVESFTPKLGQQLLGFVECYNYQSILEVLNPKKQQV